jgi:hypothetical protein
MHVKLRVPELGCNDPKRPNELFLSKTSIALLFSCHTEGTLYHCLRTGNCLKTEPSCSDFKEAAVVLNLKMSINLDKLYAEFRILRPTPAVFLNDESMQTLAACDKCCQTVLAADSGLPNVGRLISFVQSIPVCFAYVEQILPITNCYYRNDQRGNAHLIKSANSGKGEL